MPRRKPAKPPAFRELEKLHEWQGIQALLAKLRDSNARQTGQSIQEGVDINSLWTAIDAHFAKEAEQQPPPPSPGQTNP